jgi:hypothetical protein
MFNDIYEWCRLREPSLIYLSVGCAQGHWDRERSSPQQYPPFVADWPGYKVCILIDPNLEGIPYCLQDLGVSAEEQTKYARSRIIDLPGIRIYCLRMMFEIPLHTSFLHTLCDIAVYGSTKLIYQDYTGRITNELYPWDRYDTTRLKAQVLFDVTYNDCGCFVDFSKVRLLKNTKGEFIHPELEPLIVVKDHPSLLDLYRQKRRSDLGFYAHAYYQILNGKKEPRDWCTAEKVLEKINYLFKIYNIPMSMDSDSIYELLKTAIFDYCNVANCYMTEEEVDEIIEKPDQIIPCLQTLSFKEE